MTTKTQANIVDRFTKAQDSLVIQAADMSLETVAAMVASGSIDVQPTYQRRERWKPHAQSALIESFLLNIPVPPVYLAEEEFGTYSVIDGKQRLTTIKRFMRDEFSLTALDRFEELEGLKFSELPVDLQNALRIRPYLRVVTLLKQSNPSLKYEVFTRLNTGGVALKPQEIRNAMYRGKFNDLLIDLSANEFLRQQLKIRTQREDAYVTMDDVEYVLRFFTMKEQWEAFSGDYRRSMDAYMDAHRRPSTRNLGAFRKLFSESLSRCHSLWGNRAFRRYDPKAGEFRDQFLSAVFDAQMIAASQLQTAQVTRLQKKKAAVIAATKELFKDATFDDAVRVSTNTPSRVKFRVEAMHTVLTDLA